MMMNAFTDGGYSPVKRLGVWVYQISKPVYGIIEDPDSKLSCNIMEYQAVIHLLNSLPDNVSITVRSDSKLVVNQLTKNWEINWEHLRKLAEEVWKVIGSKGLHVSFQWIPREENPAGKFIEEHKRGIFRGNYRRAK